MPDSHITSKESSDSSTDSEEEEEEFPEEIGDDRGDLDDSDRAEAICKETVERILDSVFIPRKIEKKGKMYLMRLSREPVSRDDVIELSKTFEDCLGEKQVKMSGYCPIRRELYDLLFTELIREVTIDCAERGSLLLRVRDEFQLTMNAYQKLYECGVEYGSRKALEAEVEQQKVEIQYKQLQAEVQRVEQKSKELRAEIAAEEKLRQQSIDMKQARHEERMEFLKKLNRQLKEQISYIS
ncbi:unnamed protein product [Larinioides sclopetarius]|uniref:Dynein light chain n=1 Tax=Larinioides sclopetarius TaxID=280406 RepID=A0AAV2A7T1_9ARAC